MKKFIIIFIKICILLKTSNAASQEPIKVELGICSFKNITCIIRQNGGNNDD